MALGTALYPWQQGCLPRIGFLVGPRLHEVAPEVLKELRSGRPQCPDAHNGPQESLVKGAV